MGARRRDAPASTREPVNRLDLAAPALISCTIRSTEKMAFSPIELDAQFVDRVSGW